MGRTHGVGPDCLAIGVVRGLGIHVMSACLPLHFMPGAVEPTCPLKCPRHAFAPPKTRLLPRTACCCSTEFHRLKQQQPELGNREAFKLAVQAVSKGPLILPLLLAVSVGGMVRRSCSGLRSAASLTLAYKYS